MPKQTPYIYSPKNERKRHERRTAPRLPTRPCRFCGKPFHPPDPFTRYCSHRCRVWHLSTEEAEAYAIGSRYVTSGLTRFRPVSWEA